MHVVATKKISNITNRQSHIFYYYSNFFENSHFTKRIFIERNQNNNNYKNDQNETLSSVFVFPTTFSFSVFVYFILNSTLYLFSLIFLKKRSSCKRVHFTYVLYRTWNIRTETLEIISRRDEQNSASK